MPASEAITAVLQDLFSVPPTIGVLGASKKPHRPAHFVPTYLQQHGATVQAINPLYVGEDIFGRGCLATAEDATQAFGRALDAVVVFRAPDALPGHLEDLLAARPRVVWLQLGIQHDDFAEKRPASGWSRTAA